MFLSVRLHPWSEEHVARHSVTLNECEEALTNRPYINHEGEQSSRLIFGRTNSGRYLFVVAVADETPGVAFVVTAREMTQKEKKSFRRKVKGRR